MHNFRLSKDGKRIEKRLGLAFYLPGWSVGQPIYGYATYFDSSARFCQIAVLGDDIYNKVSSGSWASKYTFPTTIGHPVNIIEVQGKKLIITENGSRMIHSDGNCYQIGITEPTTVPVAAPQYSSTATTVVNDHFSDLDDWADEDSGSGSSTLATSDPGSSPGPDADSSYMRLTTGDWSPTTYAQRHMTPTESIGDVFTVEFDSYFVRVGSSGTSATENDAFFVDVFNGKFHLRLMYSTSTACILDGHDSPYEMGSPYELGTMGGPATGQWATWKFSVDARDPSSATIVSFKNGVEMNTSTAIYSPSSASAGVYVKQNRRVGDTTNAPDVYLDNFHVNDITVSPEALTGTHLYAVTYVRGGNYGCESRAAKTQIGTVTHTGYGADGTLVVTGPYANTSNISVKVTVSGTDGTGTDTVRISYDGGATYISEMKMSSVMYINYGLSLSFSDTTSHIYGENWTFDCTVCSADPTGQSVSLSSIPVSSDVQVTARKLYRTTAGGSTFFYLATINDNTTTTYVDNASDSMLGEELEDDHYVCPNGKFSCFWDNRLWVFDHENCLGYYSRINEPEHFDTVNGWVAIRRGIPGDEITGVIPYKDAIYVFKNNAIFVIQKNSVLYGVYQANNDVGCVSPWSLIEVNDYLMFRSYRGIEVYDGTSAYHFDFSQPVSRTLGTVLDLYADKITAAHNKEYNEVWFMINDRTSGSAVAVVWNYLKNKWYTFGFHTGLSCLSVCRDSTKKNVLFAGGRNGYMYLCDYGYSDHGYAISATYRKGWLDLEHHGVLRRVDVEYELETGATITTNIYVDMDKDVFRTYALTGNTPTETDREYRRPIVEKMEVGGRAKWFSIEFTNAQILTAPLKINDLFVYVRQDVHKNKKYAD